MTVIHSGHHFILSIGWRRERENIRGYTVIRIGEEGEEKKRR